jgi:hypothetical protein
MAKSLDRKQQISGKHHEKGGQLFPAEMLNGGINRTVSQRNFPGNGEPPHNDSIRKSRPQQTGKRGKQP